LILVLVLVLASPVLVNMTDINCGEKFLKKKHTGVFMPNSVNADCIDFGF
jgi:hypothetical protein